MGRRQRRGGPDDEDDDSDADFSSPYTTSTATHSREKVGAQPRRTYVTRVSRAGWLLSRDQ